MNRVLSLDLGGTSLRAATAHADHPGNLAMLGKWPAPADVESLAMLVRELCTGFDGGGPESIGITVPGLVEGTRCRWVPNLPHFDGVDLAELLAEARTPVIVGNDAQLALLAEAVLGSARSVDDAVMLSLGTGIGSAVLAAGRIIRGAHGQACSFGWACADLDDPGSERSGWLERTASGRSIDAAGGALEPPRSSAAVVAGARRGEPPCVAAIEQIARALGMALAGAVSLLDPSLVLLTGGVSEAADVLVPPMRNTLRRHLPPHLRDLRIEHGAFGSSAGLVGAAIAATQGSDWWRLR